MILFYFYLLQNLYREISFLRSVKQSVDKGISRPGDFERYLVSFIIYTKGIDQLCLQHELLSINSRLGIQL